MTAEAAVNMPDPSYDAPPPRRPRKPRAPKAAGAFLTIGELAEQLQIGQHVLRFWEAKFRQIQPMKRAGGRRYYRPDDVELLRRIQSLLYRDGYTIRGVQGLLAIEAAATAPAPPDLPLDHIMHASPEADLRRLETVTAVEATLAASDKMLHSLEAPSLGEDTSRELSIETVRVRRKDLQKLVTELVALRQLLADEE